MTYLSEPSLAYPYAGLVFPQYLMLGWEERVFRKSIAPNVLLARKSQSRSLPAVQTTQLLRPRLYESQTTF